MSRKLGPVGNPSRGQAFAECVTTSGMFGLSLGHLIILGFVALLFGHRRLPELGSAMGQGLAAFKKGLEGKDQNGNPIEDKSSNQRKG